MKKFEEPEEKAASKIFSDLAQLLLKLNEKIRGKTRFPAPGARRDEAGETDVVIIILTRRGKKARSGKSASQPVKAPSPPDDWIEDLCSEIEHSGRSRD